MFELVLGVVLAAIFVTAYLLINKLLRQDQRELGGKPTSVTLNPLETNRSLGPGHAPPRALETGEMSEHHAGGAKKHES